MYVILKCSQKKWFYIITVILIIIILPYVVYGFRLKDLSSDDDANKLFKKVENRDINDNRKPLKSFRKITKIIHVEDTDDDTENEESLDDNENDSNDDDKNYKYEFEKVHRSDFNKPVQSVFKEEEEDDDDDEEKDDEKEDNSKTEFTLKKLFFNFPNIFDIFRSNDTTSDSSEVKSNSIINWIQSFMQIDLEKSQKIETKNKESWATDYFDRWPFNVFISFEKYNSKIWIPPVLSGTVESKNHNEPLSKEHFNYLLYNLPNFVLKPSDVREVDCKNQLLILQRQLRGNKLWTLQMLDASAKIPSGILKGNTNQFGDFDSCMQIKTLVKVTPEHNVKIKGKYCLAHIDIKYSNDNLKLPVHLAKGKGMWKGHIRNPGHLIPRYTTINWGICIPHKCSHNEVYEMLKNSLDPYNSTGINFHINVEENDCQIQKNHNFLNVAFGNSKILLIFVFYCTLILAVVIATIIDYWNSIVNWASQYFKVNEKSKEISNEHSDNNAINENTKEAKDDGNLTKNDFENITQHLSSRTTFSKLIYEILMSFSLKRTIPGLMHMEPEVDIISLYTLKVISTFMLYFFTKFLMLGHLSIINRDDMIKILSNPLSILLRTPLIYLDTLLLIAGLLSSREMCKQFEQKAKISVLKIITGKLIRILPTLCAILFFQTWILPYLGSGPMWNNLIKMNAELCEQNLWRNFFGVQNFINVEESCAPFTIQLALDLQLLIIGCFIVWLYYNHEDIGIGVYGVFHAISVAARYSHTATERLSPVLFHGMNINKFYRTANIIYSSPIDRASSYLIGIGTGILIWTSDTNELNLPIFVSILTWCSSVIGILWCFWYPWYNTKINFVYDSSEAAVYSSWSPLFLSLSLAWIIFASSFTVSPITSIFNSKPLIFLSKIAYPMQLLIFSVVIYNVALNTEPIRFQITDLINFGEIFVIILIATLITVIIDYPFQNIRKVLLETEFSMVSSHEEEEMNNLFEDKSTLERNVKHQEIDDEHNENMYISKDEIENEKVFSKGHDTNTNMDWYDNDSDKTQENWRTENELEKYKSKLISNSSNVQYDERYSDEEIEEHQESAEEEED